MRTIIRVLAAGLVVATPALAEDTQKAAPPKPAPALTEAFKDMSGTWSCSGSMENPQAPGTQVKTNGLTSNGVRKVPSVLETPIWITKKNYTLLFKQGFLKKSQVCVGDYAPFCAGT